MLRKCPFSPSVAKHNLFPYSMDMHKETLSGTLERITFHNPETGFSVLKVKVPGKRETLTVVGQAPVVNVGELIDAKGGWHIDSRYGLQFKADVLQSLPPSSTDGIRRYISSGFIRGIGPEYGKRLVDLFGDRVFEIIENTPEELTQVSGIGPKRKDAIVASWQEQKAVRKIMMFLLEHGIGPARAVKIWRQYGEDAIGLIRQNPYRLSNDIRGIGFKIADQIAQSLGIELDSIERARAGLRFTLQSFLSEGHAAYPETGLLEKAKELLEIPIERLEEALVLERDEGQLLREQVHGEQWVYLSGLWHAEAGVARSLLELIEFPAPLNILDPESATAWAEKKINLRLSPSQKHAVKKAANNKVMVLTGGPGVGKTTIVRIILELYRQAHLKVVLCAPTGRAAKRLGESCNTEGKTLHRLLEADPSTGSFKRNKYDPINADLIVVDEMSMVDISLMYRLLDAVPKETALLLVGDVDQLPSVGPGLVLKQIIDSDMVPVSRLTEIFRQEEASRIIVNAHLVNHGRIPQLKPPERLSDFYFVNAEEPEEGHDLLLRLVKERIPKRFNCDPIRDIQIISPMTRGPLGTRYLNKLLQDELNPHPPEASVSRYGWNYGPGDKVIQLSNDYNKDVFNGDIGFVNAIDHDMKEAHIVFEGRLVTYLFDELDDVVPAYAITIHKSQGCEFPAVIVPVHTQHYIMLQRNLLYTAITRGKRLVVLLGTKKAVAIAVRNADSGKRFCALKERLRGVLATGKSL